VIDRSWRRERETEERERERSEEREVRCCSVDTAYMEVEYFGFVHDLFSLSLALLCALPLLSSPLLVFYPSWCAPFILFRF
jgi:hypothetical protein